LSMALRACHDHASLANDASHATHVNAFCRCCRVVSSLQAPLPVRTVHHNPPPKLSEMLKMTIYCALHVANHGCPSFRAKALGAVLNRLLVLDRHQPVKSYKEKDFDAINELVPVWAYRDSIAVQDAIRQAKSSQRERLVHFRVVIPASVMVLVHAIVVEVTSGRACDALGRRVADRRAAC
jgi:hypothetical protein